MRLPILLASVTAFSSLLVLAPLSASESTPKTKEIYVKNIENLRDLPSLDKPNLPSPSTKPVKADPTPKKVGITQRQARIKAMIAENFADYTVPVDLYLWVDKASQLYNVKASLILSIIKKESGFRTKVVNSGNVGLMQVHPPSHKITRSYLLNGEKNVLKGTEVFADYRKQLGGSDKKALHAYNRGITAYKKGARNPSYVREILRSANSAERKTQPLTLAQR